MDTYAQFAEENEAVLRTVPAPKIAKSYYSAGDMYYFDEFSTSRAPGERRPVVDTLYDVFCNIRDDEGEHVSTMSACQGAAREWRRQPFPRHPLPRGR